MVSRPGDAPGATVPEVLVTVPLTVPVPRRVPPVSVSCWPAAPRMPGAVARIVPSVMVAPLL